MIFLVIHHAEISEGLEKTAPGRKGVCLETARRLDFHTSSGQLCT